MTGDALRILVVSSFLPSRTSGGRVRLRALVKGLARSHAVSLLSFGSPTADDDAAVRDLTQQGVVVRTVPNRRIAASRLAKRARQLRSLLSTRSFEWSTYDDASFQAAIDDAVVRSSFDVVHVEGAAMANFTFPPAIPVVLDEQNVEYDVLRRAASITRSIPRRLFTRLNAAKVRVEEERAWCVATACALPSARDEAIVRAAVPDALTAVVPNGVDLEFFAPGGRPRRPATVLFFGELGYYPNTDALHFLFAEIWPAVKRSVPAAELVVVGPSAPPAIQRLASKAADARLTGAVPDVRPYLEAATVLVVPLRIGGGTRLKILEAMAMQTPVVSTSLGAEGLAVTDGEDILLANTADGIADRVSRVLRDGSLGARLGGSGRRLVEDRYDWTSSVRRLEGLYRSAMASSEDTASRAASTRLWRARKA